MGVILGLFIVAIIGYVGSIYAFSKEKLPAPIRYLFFSGWEFMLIGVAMGKLGLDLFSPEMLINIDPVIHFGLGWIGLVMGLQLRIPDLLRINKRHMAVTWLQATAVGLLVGLAAYPFLKDVFADKSWVVIPATIALAASASISSPTILFMIGRESKFRRDILRLLHLITNLDGVIAVLILGISFTVLRPSVDMADGFALAGQAMVAAAVLSILFLIFPRKNLTSNELLTVLLAFVLFSSGVGGMLQLSPLFLNLICGAILANSLPTDDMFHQVIIDKERPVYIIMLILAGLYFTPPNLTVLLLCFGLTALRFLVKYIFVSHLAPLMEPDLPFPKHTGLTVISQGGMAVAIGFSFLTAYPASVGGTIFSVILISVTINEIIAPFLATKVLHTELKQ